MTKNPCGEANPGTAFADRLLQQYKSGGLDAVEITRLSTRYNTYNYYRLALGIKDQTPTATALWKKVVEEFKYPHQENPETNPETNPEVNPLIISTQVSRERLGRVSSFVTEEVKPGLVELDLKTYREKYPHESHFYITVGQIIRLAETQLGEDFKLIDRNTVIYKEMKLSRNTLHRDITNLFEEIGFEKVRRGEWKLPVNSTYNKNTGKYELT